MPENNTQTRAINRDKSRFHDHLDFEFLRQQGIDHLAKFSGNLWTDHNLHDPGITILENLIYALLDLGYATNHKFEDLIALKPKEVNEEEHEIADIETTLDKKDENCDPFKQEVKLVKDNNFFRASQILGNNPLTILDYRKLLIDQPEIRNAWLKVSYDEQDLCKKRGINGLYHVYIDIENSIENEYNISLNKKTGLPRKIRDMLMSHRNFCEDFIDVTILCKEEIGLCADIELKDNADLEFVFDKIINNISNFITPTPNFYSLEQLLKKKKTIEEIFAGHPIDLKQSHGFVDVDELEKLKLKKEIRKSDLYQIILGTSGVVSVKNLAFRKCNGKICKEWKYKIAKNHVAEFSLKCSGFRFIRQGIPVQFDQDKFLDMFQLAIQGSKAPYNADSLNLNREIPKGMYRKDLADYYSIQHDFPKVYGISEGGLSPDVSSHRKAQAYQLKAYLLFFDQLLANYLSQLQNIRSLFAMYPEKDVEQHTYFINQVDSVPDLPDLLRLRKDEASKSKLAPLGSTLLFPVDRKQLEVWIVNNDIKNKNPENIARLEFLNGTERDLAVQNIMNDLQFLDLSPEIVEANDRCFFYYFMGTSKKTAFVSSRVFPDKQSAKQNAENVKFVGTFDENYRSFQTKQNKYSFQLEYNLSTYPKYLQLISEDEDLFSKRRHQFLDHLLSRFAEKFNDYALLSYGIYNKEEIQGNEIKLKERFLKNYPDISSNRGKGYDYIKNNWSNNNISGVEKRFMALSGIKELKKHDLCHFEVDEYEKNFIINLQIGQNIKFRSKSTFSSKNEALPHAIELFRSLSQAENYEVIYNRSKLEYEIRICYNKTDLAFLNGPFLEKQMAQSYVDYLHRLFSVGPFDDDIAVSRSVYRGQLVDYIGHTKCLTAADFRDKSVALSQSKKTINKINDAKLWRPGKGYKTSVGKLVAGKRVTGIQSYFATDQFKIDVNDNIIGKPDKFTFTLLDRKNTFKFSALTEYPNSTQARLGCYRLLFNLLDKSSYRIEIREDKKYEIIIHNPKAAVAKSATTFATEQEARKYQEKISRTVLPHCYDLKIDEVPTHWKFKYFLTDGRDDHYEFRSSSDYDSVDRALKAGSEFATEIANTKLDIVGKELVISTLKKTATPVCRLCGHDNITLEKTLKDKTEIYLSDRQEVLKYHKAKNKNIFERFVDLDEQSKKGTFVYRVVDNDNIVARSSQQSLKKEEARQFRKNLLTMAFSGYEYLQICLGGDIVTKRKDQKLKKTIFHYQIKCRNKYYSKGKKKDEAIVLFESTRGFDSHEKAEDAFKKHYLKIFYLALCRDNYGKGEKIELVQTYYDEDPCNHDNAVAFIPMATIDELGSYEERSIREIIKLVKSYPITYKGKEEYQFHLLNPTTGEVEWNSCKQFKTAEEARKEFEFFKVLLNYSGNYAILKGDNCNYKVHIREVLAESNRRYKTKDEAWIELEKFIRVAQGEKTIHLVNDNQLGCYSNFYACESKIIHPCHYQSEMERDNILTRLYRAAKTFVPINLIPIEQFSRQSFIKSLDGKRIARLKLDQGKAPDKCSDLWFTLVESALKHENYRQSENGISLVDDDNRKLLVPYDQSISLECWKELLFGWAYYFPIVRTRKKKCDQKKKENDPKEKECYLYHLEIKFPGINDFRIELNSDRPCNCEDKEDKEEISTNVCHVAWKVKCKYTSCQEALDKFRSFHEQMKNHKNYRPVFECECGPFGIKLYQDEDIIARNPQCYPSPKIACEAIERSVEKLNCEGLHVVEHILLRPHCEEDCKCKHYVSECESQTHCKFPWYVKNDDPCNAEPDICFILGQDPYSFIATAVLPAWPKRFRSKESRELVERLLRQETPAHILLRVLWLTPQDFCRFETSFKNWNKYVGEKQYCDKNVPVNCLMLDLIFSRNYRCMNDEEVCKTCPEEEILLNPCIEHFGKTGRKGIQLKTKLYSSQDFLNEINKLYCWETQNCQQSVGDKIKGDDTKSYKELKHQDNLGSEKNKEQKKPTEQTKVSGQ